MKRELVGSDAQGFERFFVCCIFRVRLVVKDKLGKKLLCCKENRLGMMPRVLNKNSVLHFGSGGMSNTNLEILLKKWGLHLFRMLYALAGYF